MQREVQLRARPARKIFYDGDEATKADRKLAAAFERTNPGFGLVDDDAPTLVRWALPTVGLLVVGFFVGRWWKGRHAAQTLVGDGDDTCGFDSLGCD